MKIGFLPLYIELYDRSGSTSRDRLEPFYETLARAFEEKGIEVVRSSFCRLEEEFKNAVNKFEENQVDCIVTWHAAYSPSLESIQVLANTPLPIVVLDTTETYDFSPSQDSGEISYCHGIHGVMDMCNMLTRYHKSYAIATGHYPNSDVLDRAIGYIRAAVAATSVAGSTVGQIGQSFPGMGDFLISDEEISSRFGVKVVRTSAEELEALKSSVTDAEIQSEMAEDLADAIKLNQFSEDAHRLTVKNCLAVRRWLEKHQLDAFSVDFMDISSSMGLDCMPFMEACKAMARGIGYAGEGDILTAVMTGALLRGFGTATFVEIFCPDWKNDTLFLSHMGEVNFSLTKKEKSIKEINFVYTDAQNPIVKYACLKKGTATFLNLFCSHDGYKLLIAPVTMEEPVGEDKFTSSIRGWMRPEMPIADFLEKISMVGVTHHSMLVYDATPEQIAFFGRLLGLEIIRL
ncbi:MAG: hypothetical protein KHW79_08555 [Clostridiales bacterium]|nr:hypothetical protein [Clostridiales bacterium]